MGKQVDLTHLSEEECENILKVVQRDFELRQQEKERLEKLQLDVEELQSKAGTEVVDNNNNNCSLCRAQFRFLVNPRYRCSLCSREFCKKCILKGAEASQAVAAAASANSSTAAKNSTPLEICKICELQRKFYFKSAGARFWVFFCPNRPQRVKQSYKRQTNSWFYTSIQRRYKRFGSAKVVRSLYRRKTSSTDALYYQGEESEGEGEDGMNSGYQSETGIDRLREDGTDRIHNLNNYNLNSYPPGSMYSDGIMEDIIEVEDENGFGEAGGTLAPFKNRLRHLARNIHRLRYIRRLQNQFEKEEESGELQDDDDEARPVLLDSEDQRRQRTNIRNIMTDMVDSLMCQLNGEANSNENSERKIDEEAAKEVLRQCVPHLCTALQQDSEPTVNPVIPFGIDYRELNLDDYITQLSTAVLSHIIEEPVSIQNDSVDIADGLSHNDSTALLLLMKSSNPQLPSLDIEDPGVHVDENGSMEAPWSLKGPLLLGQKVPSAPQNRFNGGSEIYDKNKPIYLPNEGEMDLMHRENEAEFEKIFRQNREQIHRLSDDTDKETDSDTDSGIQKQTRNMVKYPTILLSKKDSMRSQLSADDSCSTISTDIEEGEPRFLNPPENFHVESGQKLKVDCKVQGTRPTDVFWYKDSVTLEQLDDDQYLMTRRGLTYSLEFIDPTELHSGLYLCIAVNEHGHCQHRFMVTVQPNKGGANNPAEGIMSNNTYSQPKFGYSTSGYLPSDHSRSTEKRDWSETDLDSELDLISSDDSRAKVSKNQGSDFYGEHYNKANQNTKAINSNNDLSDSKLNTVITNSANKSSTDQVSYQKDMVNKDNNDELSDSMINTYGASSKNVNSKDRVTAKIISAEIISSKENSSAKTGDKDLTTSNSSTNKQDDVQNFDFSSTNVSYSWGHKLGKNVRQNDISTTPAETAIPASLLTKDNSVFHVEQNGVTDLSAEVNVAKVAPQSGKSNSSSTDNYKTTDHANYNNSLDETNNYETELLRADKNVKPANKVLASETISKLSSEEYGFTKVPDSRQSIPSTGPTKDVLVDEDETDDGQMMSTSFLNNSPQLVRHGSMGQKDNKNVPEKSTGTVIRLGEDKDIILNKDSQSHTDKHNSSSVSLEPEEVLSKVQVDRKKDQNITPLLLDFTINDTTYKGQSHSTFEGEGQPGWSRGQLTKDSGISVFDSPRSSMSESDSQSSPRGQVYRGPINYQSLERPTSKTSPSSADSDTANLGWGKPAGGIYGQAKNRSTTSHVQDVEVRAATPLGDIPVDKEFDFTETRDRFSSRSRHLSNSSTASSSHELEELEATHLPSVRDLRIMFNKPPVDTGVKRVYSLTTRTPPAGLKGHQNSALQRTSSDRGKEAGGVPQSSNLSPQPKTSAQSIPVRSISSSISPSTTRNGTVGHQTTSPLAQQDRSSVQQNGSRNITRSVGSERSNTTYSQPSHNTTSAQRSSAISQPGNVSQIRSSYQPQSGEYNRKANPGQQVTTSPSLSARTTQVPVHGVQDTSAARGRQPAWATTFKDVKPTKIPTKEGSPKSPSTPKSPKSPKSPTTLEETYVPLSPRPVNNQSRKDITNTNARF